MTANATTPALPSSDSLTLAKTGLVGGVPALIAFEGSKKTLLLVAKDDGTWTPAETVAHGGIRGMGLLVKKLDAGTVRPADATPVWLEGVPAAEEKAPEAPPAAEPVAAPVESVKAKGGKRAKATPAPVVVAAPPAPAAKATKAPKAEKPAPVAKPVEVKPAEPARPVADAGLVAFFGADRALALATTTDFAVLRAAREEAVKGGAPADVVRAVTLRAGEVACGFSLVALKRTSAKPAQADAASGEGAPRAYTDADLAPYAALVAAHASRPAEQRFTAEELTAFGFPSSAGKHPTYWMSTGSARAKLATLGYAANLHPNKGGLIVWKL